MGGAPEFIKFRHILNCHAAGAHYGAGVAKALGLAIAIESKKYDPALESPAEPLV